MLNPRKLSLAEFEDEDEEAFVTPTKIETASALLQDLLKDGAMPVSEIIQIMAETNIGQKTAQRARQRIGAVQEYKNGAPIWRLN